LIRRVYIKELVGFEEVNVDFNNGLVVFTGPSGAGKSVFMSAILANFGYTTPSQASVCSVELEKPDTLLLDSFMLEEELTVKGIKKGSVRYYLNEQKISKKSLKSSFAPYVQFLSVRDKGSFESEKLLQLLDSGLNVNHETFATQKEHYQKRFHTYQEKKKLLTELQSDDQALMERLEFARFEIEKIERIQPKVGEDETLLEQKQMLSKVDKIKDALEKVEPLFMYEEGIYELYKLLGKEVEEVSELFNQIRMSVDEATEQSAELEELNIEEILDRISDISSLQKKYGSIEEALVYKEEKYQEIAKFENLEQDRSELETFIIEEEGALKALAEELTQLRTLHAKELEGKIADYLQALKLPALTFEFSTTTLGIEGVDKIDILLNNSHAHTLSGGEFNRVRLALLAASMYEQSGGVLILDEIDANVSGDESIAIAQMLKRLSEYYQIFAISHQPHLSAYATQHILVTKDTEVSYAKVLDEEERVGEIARIIGGENPAQQAIAFAKEIRESV
jgi:DNA repair protein RecN (Recombination protein N)